MMMMMMMYISNIVDYIKVKRLPWAGHLMHYEE